jgi:hypothetical protein
MQTEAILVTLAAAASFLKKPVQDTAGQALKDLYEKTKGYIRAKLGSESDAATALEKLEEKPESDARRAVAVEELEPTELAEDRELARLVKQLRAHLADKGYVTQNVSVRGNRNKVNIAGRDLIQTDKVVRKNEITPDERHITGEQATKLRDLNAELAQYLANEAGKADYSAGFRILEKEFGVSSYLLIPRNRYADAVSLLKQRRAMNRPKLRRRNPIAYQNDYFRGIWARARELDWEKPQVYQFALAKLELKKPISTLKALGPNQLKSLGEFMQREVKRA